MIIDCHAHIAAPDILLHSFFESWADNLESKLPPEARGGVTGLLRGLNQDPDCVRLVAEMDAAGIEKCVLLIIDFGWGFPDEALPLEPLYLRHRKICETYPGRFLVFAGADPRRGKDGLELFERSLRDWGFRGLKLYPPCGYSPSDPALFDYYELCRQYDVPILTHVGPTAPCLSFRHTHPTEIDDAARAFPKVAFILGHAAAVLHEEAGLLAEYRPNIYLELSGFQTEIRRRNFGAILRRHKQRGLARKLVFGTDWPIHRLLGSQQQCVDAVRNALREEAFNPEEADRILGGNAGELLRLPAACNRTEEL